ncbi:MAG: chorismate synthase [Candidatus Marinimicrobia bacterium]|nr:chorismate synthase [Candidatus Neomarinimicrobiota bacterium]
MLTKLKYLTAGESHGKGLLGIIEGLPAGLEIDEAFIANQLFRRQQGHGRGGRMKIESDRAEIYTGVRHGCTLGSPVGLVLPNKDWENWTQKMASAPIEEDIKKVTLPRPGHADLAGVQKFDFDDIRNVLERSSARETAMRVALATLCRKLLLEVGIEVGSRVTRIASAKDDSTLPETLTPTKLIELADASPVRCLDKKAEKEMMAAIDKAKADGDSVGGIFEIIATGLPYGLGSYTQWDRKLQARIAESIMSVNAFKGIEIGMGFAQAEKPGSVVHDEIGWNGEKYTRFSNNAGGIEGGMSNAQPLVVRAVMKPIPTLIKPLRSVDIESKQDKPAHKERTDSCAVPAASIVAESMLCFVLADAILEKFGGDTMEHLKEHIKLSGKY